MPGIVVVGLQWGDEGKGKVVDLLARFSSVVVRSQGGNNAGHTVKLGDQEFALHLIPSGILQEQNLCCITAGCLVNPKVLCEEIQMLESKGIAIRGRLQISAYAHIILPFHQKLDQLYEASRGSDAIGTTKRGIGPCASDRAGRISIRMAEFMHPEIFRNRLIHLGEIKNLELEKIYNQSPLDLAEIYDEYSKYSELLCPYYNDHLEFDIRSAILRDEMVLFEGAHGALLDPLFGSYPFVTSTPTITSGICLGAAIGPHMIDQVFGVLKAYTTRVGGGPLPTELRPDELAPFNQVEQLRERGTTTGRVRRIGWLDLVLARYAVELNQVDDLVLTKLDVLDHLNEIQVCIGYSLDGQLIERPPVLVEDLERVEPIYRTFEGWNSSTTDVRRIHELPKNARILIEAIEEYCDTPVALISVGPSREQTIEVNEEWS